MTVVVWRGNFKFFLFSIYRYDIHNIYLIYVVLMVFGSWFFNNTFRQWWAQIHSLQTMFNQNGCFHLRNNPTKQVQIVTRRGVFFLEILKQVKQICYFQFEFNSIYFTLKHILWSVCLKKYYKPWTDKVPLCPKDCKHKQIKYYCIRICCYKYNSV